jgi:hypothetical protein
MFPFERVFERRLSDTLTMKARPVAARGWRRDVSTQGTEKADPEGLTAPAPGKGQNAATARCRCGLFVC